MGKLVLLLADGTTQDVLLTKERMMIGRRADNDVCLPYPAVSGEHAAVVTILADSFLEDLGSTNGTLVNGKPIVKHFLRDHDQIDIGRQRLVFVSNDETRVDPLPVDMARSQLLGLNNRVESVPQRSAQAPSTGNPRGDGANMPLLVYPDLEDAELLEPSPPPEPVAPTPRREAAPPSQRGSAPAPRRDVAPPPPSPFVDHRPPATRRDTDQRIAAWAAEWAAPTGHAGTGTIDTSSLPPEATPEDRGHEVGSAAQAAARALDPAERTPPDPTVRVLSGPNLGRAVPFNKDELTVGRVGVQVAVLRKVADGFRLVPVEGAQPPRINGAPVAPEGTPLHPGDTFEVAGVRLELSVAG